MFSLDWIGKTQVLNHHNEIPYKLVECCEAVKNDNFARAIVTKMAFGEWL